MKIARLPAQGGATGSSRARASSAPAPSDPQIDLDVMRAEIDSLYGAGYATAAGGFATGLLFWALFYRQTHDTSVLLWALLLHATQALRLITLVAFKRAHDVRARAPLWLQRYRVTLFATSIAWGLAPLMFMPHDDLALALLMMLVLLGMAVGGLAGNAADRVSVSLWLLFGLLAVSLLGEWASRRLRGAR